MTDDGSKRALLDALAYALARAPVPTAMTTNREYAEALAPLVVESGYLPATPDPTMTSAPAAWLDAAVKPGREELWQRFTAGEKLAYGCGYRDARAESSPTPDAVE